MSTADVQTHHTAEDLLTMPDDGALYELVDGVLVEKNMGGLSSWVGIRIATILATLVDDQSLGWILGSDASYQCFGEERETVRKPDVSFIRRGRLPGEELPTGHILIAPDLAVEVVSPKDRFYDVQTKISEYLAAGVTVVWIVNPADQSVTVYAQSTDQPVIFRDDNVLTGGDALPEFRCSVAELFRRPVAKK